MSHSTAAHGSKSVLALEGQGVDIINVWSDPAWKTLSEHIYLYSPLRRQTGGGKAHL